MAYIIFSEFESFGGSKTVNETAFTSLLYEVETKLDFLTNGRIQKLDTVPDEVKHLCARLVNLYASVNVDRDPSLTSYSNGIESFGYTNSVGNSTDSTVLDKKFAGLVNDYLWKYPQLTNRGRCQWRQP